MRRKGAPDKIEKTVGHYQKGMRHWVRRTFQPHFEKSIHEILKWLMFTGGAPGGRARLGGEAKTSRAVNILRLLCTSVPFTTRCNNHSMASFI
jgi:hypothetical protein